MRTKTRLLLFTLAGLLAASLPAFAGFGFSASWREVRVSAGAWADGSMRATRASADSVAYLRCYVYSTPSGDSARCSARDAAGAYVSCYTANERLVATIRTIGPDDRVYFAVSAGSCSWIEVHHDSQYLP